MGTSEQMGAKKWYILLHFSTWPSLKMRVTNFDQEQPPIFPQIGIKNVQET